MPKHRSTGFAVVREIVKVVGNFPPEWVFHGIVGVYFSIQRAEEVAAGTIQKYLDQGMNPEAPEFKCSVHTTVYYDE